MAVNLSKNNLCINQIIEQKNEKITIESDEIVPDIKPDGTRRQSKNRGNS